MSKVLPAKTARCSAILGMIGLSFNFLSHVMLASVTTSWERRRDVDALAVDMPVLRESDKIHC